MWKGGGRGGWKDRDVGIFAASEGVWLERERISFERKGEAGGNERTNNERRSLCFM